MTADDARAARAELDRLTEDLTSLMAYMHTQPTTNRADLVRLNALQDERVAIIQRLAGIQPTTRDAMRLRLRAH